MPRRWCRGTSSTRVCRSLLADLRIALRAQAGKYDEPISLGTVGPPGRGRQRPPSSKAVRGGIRVFFFQVMANPARAIRAEFSWYLRDGCRVPGVRSPYDDHGRSTSRKGSRRFRAGWLTPFSSIPAASSCRDGRRLVVVTAVAAFLHNLIFDGRRRVARRRAHGYFRAQISTTSIIIQAHTSLLAVGFFVGGIVRARRQVNPVNHCAEGPVEGGAVAETEAIASAKAALKELNEASAAAGISPHPHHVGSLDSGVIHLWARSWVCRTITVWLATLTPWRNRVAPIA